MNNLPKSYPGIKLLVFTIVVVYGVSAVDIDSFSDVAAIPTLLRSHLLMVFPMFLVSLLLLALLPIFLLLPGGLPATLLLLAHPDVQNVFFFAAEGSCCC
jgi:hypothetical protein